MEKTPHNSNVIEMRFILNIIFTLLISCNQNRDFKSTIDSNGIVTEPDITGKMIGKWKFLAQTRNQVDSAIKLPDEYLNNLPVESFLVKATDTIISVEMTPNHKFYYVSRGDTTEYYYTVYSNEINLHKSDYIVQLDYMVHDSILILFDRDGVFDYEISFLKQ